MDRDEGHVQTLQWYLDMFGSASADGDPVGPRTGRTSREAIQVFLVPADPFGAPRLTSPFPGLTLSRAEATAARQLRLQLLSVSCYLRCYHRRNIFANASLFRLLPLSRPRKPRSTTRPPRGTVRPRLRPGPRLGPGPRSSPQPVVAPRLHTHSRRGPGGASEARPALAGLQYLQKAQGALRRRAPQVRQLHRPERAMRDDRSPAAREIEIEWRGRQGTNLSGHSEEEAAPVSVSGAREAGAGAGAGVSSRGRGLGGDGDGVRREPDEYRPEPRATGGRAS